MPGLPGIGVGGLAAQLHSRRLPGLQGNRVRRYGGSMTPPSPWSDETVEWARATLRLLGRPDTRADAEALLGSLVPGLRRIARGRREDRLLSRAS